MTEQEKELVAPDPPAGWPGSEHPITGYRTLNLAEIELINRVKALGVDIQNTLDAVKFNTASTIDGSEPPPDDMTVLVDPRLLALARTNFQQGLGWLARSISRPEGL